jgi:3-methyladenine DNA glycosylase AlkD
MSPRCEDILREMRALARADKVAGMERFGIRATTALGLTVPQVRKLARGIGRDQALAEELWASGVHEARWLASLIAEPSRITKRTADAWTRDMNSWDVCDACCCNLFDRMPFVWERIPRWAASKREYVRRTAFATLACAAVHDKRAEDARFQEGLALIEKYAFDERNFVRKAVNWALRNIGKRNEKLLSAAVDCAYRLRQQNTPSARWIAADALREFRAKFGEERVRRKFTGRYN